MKKFWSILLACVMLLALTACGGDSGETADSGDGAEEAKTFKVGINNWGQANFFARIGKAAMEDELEKLGCEVVATVTDNVADRMEAIETMVQQGCDAIIIEEGDLTECESAVLEAKEAGIVIGSMDAGTADYVDIYVSSDNSSLGKLSAEALVEAIDAKGKVVMIVNDSGSMTRMRAEAAEEVFAQYPDIEVAYKLTYSWPDYDADMMDQVSAVLQANPNPGDISGVFAVFDGVGISAYKAIKEAGLQDYIPIVGVDGDPDAYAVMQEEGSNYVCTMAQDPDTIARTVCDLVVDILNGETLESNVVYIPGIKVTQDNVADYVE